MNFNLTQSDNAQEIWPGHADVNREGVALAIEMLDELQIDDAHTIEGHLIEADLCCLEDWPREGLPFRNIVAEYLQRARAMGPAIEAGFCAVLSDMAAMVVSGMPRDISNYAEWYEVE